MIVFTLDNNDGGDGELSNPKLQVNLNLNARLLVVSQVQVCHLHFLNSKRVFILWLCNLAHRVVCVVQQS